MVLLLNNRNPFYEGFCEVSANEVKSGVLAVCSSIAAFENVAAVMTLIGWLCCREAGV